ncbi:Peptidyl-prolyl isomerase cwc27 [Rhodotorula kratochvilovae]
MSFVVTEPITEGVVVLHTSLGDILIELWKRECPKAVRNFVQLCLEGHYDGVPFHRIVPGFIAQTGGGDDCIYDEGSFGIEANQRLKFNRRGLVAMAADPTTKYNSSQFFLTLDATPELQNKHTLFGRVTGDSLFNLLKLAEIELEPGTDKPVYAPVIKSAEVRVDPFEEGPDPIRPRITAEERKEQEKAKREMKAERAKERQQGKRKGTKNKALLSFGTDEPEADDASLPKTKFKSAHDALQDARLRAEVIDDRGLSATLPPELMGGGLAQAGREDKGKKRAAEDGGRDEKRQRAEPSITLEEARKLKAEKAGKSEAERRKEEIAKLQAELKKSSRPAEDAAPAKPKRTGPSLLQLEREKYIRGGGATKASKGKRRAGADDDDVLSALEGFRSKLFEAGKSAPKEKEREEDDGRLHGIDLNEDELEEDTEGWMAHSLKFRKDATMDRHTADEYELVDPLAKNALTLDEIRAKADAGRRRYPGERDSGRGEGTSRGGGGGSGGGGRERYGGGSGGGDRYGGGGGRERYSDSRGGYGEGAGGRAQGDWKKDRVSTTDLA